MKIEQLIENLGVDEHLNESLQLITDIIVDTPVSFEERIAEIIATPEKIFNTNRFASLLSDLPSERYIQPLIIEVSKSTPGKTPWLRDYMYALFNLLDELDEAYVPETDFVDLLGYWLFNTGGGEISWKSAMILSSLDHPQTVKYCKPALISTDLFHQTRIACLRSVVNSCGMAELELYQNLLQDPEKEVREAVQKAMSWLNRIRSDA